MNMLKIFILIICLFLLETNIVFAFLFLEDFIETGSFFMRPNTLNDMIGITWLRIVIYGVPQMIIFYFSLSFVFKKGYIALSLLNMMSFFAITVTLLSIAGDLQDFLVRLSFYYAILATGLSPLILSSIPFSKKLISEID